MFDVKRSIYFIHIPKTAGQSIIQMIFTDTLSKRLFLGGGGKRDESVHGNFYHLTPQEIIDFGFDPKKKMDSFYKFTAIRNPWARAVSQWAYGRYDNLKFPDFVDHLINKNYAPLLPGTRFKNEREMFQYCRPQSDYVYINGKQIIDYIMRFENIEEDLKFIRGKLDVTAELPKINRSRHNDYKEYYTDDLKERIGNYYAVDVKNFNYTFEK